MSFPILNVFNECSKFPKQLIEDLRQKIVERVEKNPDLYYSEDIDKIKTNDWSVGRYLYNYIKDPDVSKGLDNLDKALKWRKSFGVLDLNDKHFPKEIYLSAGVVIYGKDLNGSQIMIMRGKLSKKMKSWIQNGHKFLVYMIEKVDNENLGKGLTVLMDCIECGIKNANMETIKFLNQVFNDYYPGLVNASLVYKLPPVLEAIYKVVKSWLNEEQNKYVYMISNKTIGQYVASDQLPDFLDGTNTEPYRTVPDDAPDVHQLAIRLGIKAEKGDKLIKHLQKFYDN